MTSTATADLSPTMVSTATRRCGRLIDSEIADRLLEAGEGLSLILEDVPPGRLDVLPEALGGALAAVRDAAHACLTALGSDRRESPEEATKRKLARSALDDVHDTAVRLLEAFEENAADRRDVVWR